MVDLAQTLMAEHGYVPVDNDLNFQRIQNATANSTLTPLPHPSLNVNYMNPSTYGNQNQM